MFELRILCDCASMRSLLILSWWHRLRWHAFICDPNKPISNSRMKLLFCAYLIMFMHPNGTNGNRRNGKFNKCQMSTEHLTHAGREQERVMEHFARNTLSSTKCSIQYKNMIAGCHDEKAALCCVPLLGLCQCALPGAVAYRLTARLHQKCSIYIVECRALT